MLNTGNNTIEVKADLKDGMSGPLAAIKESFLRIGEVGKQATEELAAGEEKASKTATAHAKAVDGASTAHKGLAAAIANTIKATDKAQTSTGNFLLGLTKMAGGFALFQIGSKAVEVLGDNLKDCINTAIEGQQIQTKLNVTLADTGKITGVTKDQLEKLTDAMMLHSTYSKDTIESAEGVMAAFTQISKNVFPGAMTAAANLAAKMGIDLPNAARLVGRALDNPAQGMMSLTRYGITLTAGMKESIKTFIAHGETAKAQGVILDALKTKFGGIAEALGGTFQGRMQQFQNQMEATKEKIGLALLPILSNLMGALNPVISAIGDILPTVLDVLTTFITGNVMPVLNQFGSIFSKLFPYIKQAGDALMTALKPAFGAIGEILSNLSPAMAVFTTSVDLCGKSGDSVGGKIKAFGHILVDVATTVGQVLAPILQLAGAISQLLGVAFVSIVQTIGNFIAPLFSAKEGSEAFSNSLKGGLIGVLTLVTNGIKSFTAFLKSNSQQAQIVKDILTAVGLVIAGVLVGPVTAIIGGIVLLVAGFKNLWDRSEALRTVLSTLGSGALTLLKTLVSDISVGFANLVPHLKDAWNHFTDIASGIGGILLPVLKILGGAILTGLVNTFNSLVTVLGFLKGVFQAVWPYIAIVVGTAIKNVLTILGTFLGSIGNIMTLIGDLLHGRWNKILGDILKIFLDLGKGILQLLGNTFGGIGGLFVQLWNDLGTKAAAGLGHLKDGIGHNLGLIGQQWDAQWDAVKNALGNAMGWLYDHTIKPLTQIYTAWYNSTQGIRNVVGAVLGWLFDNFTKLATFINQVFTTIGLIMLALFKKAWDAVSKVVGDALGWIGDRISTAFNFYKNIFTVVWNAVVVVISAVWNNIKTAIGNALGWLGDHISAAFNADKTLIQNVWNDISSIIGNIWNKITTVIKNALSNIGSWLNTQWTNIKNTAGNIWNGIKTAIGNVWTDILNLIQGKVTSVKNAVLSPFQQAASAIPGIVRGFGNSIIDGLNHGIKGAGSILDWLGQRLDDIAQKLIGSRPIAHFSFTNIPHFAKGTDSFEGGLAIVGEEGPELVSMPKGSKVMPAKETSAFLQGRVPQFAGGIGDILGDIGNFFSSRISDLKSAAATAMSKLISAVPGLGGLAKLGGVYGSLAGGAIHNIQAWGLHALQGWLSNFGAGSAGVVTGGHITGVLPGFPLMNQLALTDRNKDNDCVPTSLAAAASYDLHRIISPTLIKDAVYGAGYMGGQSAGRYIPEFRKLGLNLHSVGGGNGTLVSYIHRYLSAGIPVIGTIPSDWNNANASLGGGSTHVIAFAGQTKGGLTAMNPWRGFWQQASDNWWMPRLRYNSIWPVQKMANGGVIDEMVLGIGQSSGKGYMLGEAGREYVVPSSKAGGTSETHVHIYLDGREITDTVATRMVKAIRHRVPRQI